MLVGTQLSWLILCARYFQFSDLIPGLLSLYNLGIGVVVSLPYNFYCIRGYVLICQLSTVLYSTTVFIGRLYLQLANFTSQSSKRKRELRRTQRRFNGPTVHTVSEEEEEGEQ